MRNQTIAQEGVERRYGGQTLKAKTQPADEPGARIKYAARKARRGIPPSVQDSFPTTGSAAVRRGCCAGCGQSRYTDRACIGYVLIQMCIRDSDALTPKKRGPKVVVSPLLLEKDVYKRQRQ